MPTFAVLVPIPEPALALLREAGEVRVGAAAGSPPRGELERLVTGADAILAVPTAAVDGAVADLAGPGRKVVANIAVGYDNLAVEELVERGVTVTNTPGVLTAATADLAIALILSVSRRLGEGERVIRSRTEWVWGLDFMLGRSIQGRTLGVVGMGEIGRATAARARAFGMEIAYFNRSRLDPGVEAELGARWLAFEELLETADVLTLHCPLTPQTRHLIDAAALARMKPSAFLVNTARGPVVDEAALAAALAAGTIAGAALDVFEREPEVHPGLLELDNVVLVPHLGSATVETREQMATLAARNAIEVSAGRPPLTPVAAPGGDPS
ncbi:MAG: D-glycerate dehydrogenase [Solirubrobacterales bacterium]